MDKLFILQRLYNNFTTVPGVFHCDFPADIWWEFMWLFNYTWQVTFLANIDFKQKSELMQNLLSLSKQILGAAITCKAVIYPPNKVLCVVKYKGNLPSN